MSEAAGGSAGVTAGELLRAARDKQGLHLAILAASLKVAPRKLELLEANRYDELPDATFVRALALSMCRALKIDAEPILARLPQPAGHGLEQVARGLNQPFRDREVRREPGEWHRAISLPGVASLLLVVAALGVLFWPGRDRVADTVASVPAVVVEAASGVLVAASMVPAPASTAVPEVVAAATPEPAAAASAAPVGETVFSAPAVESGATATAGPLQLRTRGESWVEVIDAGGQVLLSRVLVSGELVGLDGRPPLRVTVGNADVTDIVFRGKPVSLTAVTRDNVARLELP